jgi:hypothetical protein
MNTVIKFLQFGPKPCFVIFMTSQTNPFNLSVNSQYMSSTYMSILNIRSTTLYVILWQILETKGWIQITASLCTHRAYNLVKKIIMDKKRTQIRRNTQLWSSLQKKKRYSVSKAHKIGNSDLTENARRIP